MDFEALIHFLNKQLALPLPGKKGQEGMLHPYRYTPVTPPDHAKKSAVLLTLFENSNLEPSIILIKRALDNSPHSGQIAFPGGKFELTDKDLFQTALRESREEINLNTNTVQLIGAISPLYVPVSNYVIHPFLVHTNNINDLVPAPDEVANILTAPLFELFSNKGEVKVSVKAAPTGNVTTPAYILANNNYIWGATAMILSELEYIVTTNNIL